jgi:hypothetical protein
VLDMPVDELAEHAVVEGIDAVLLPCQIDERRRGIVVFSAAPFDRRDH